MISASVRLIIESIATLTILVIVALAINNLWQIGVLGYEYQPCGCVAEPFRDGLRVIHYCPTHERTLRNGL